MTAKGFDLGPITISFFSLINLIALSAWGAVAYRAARRRSFSPSLVVNLLVRMLLLAVILGRLIFILDPPPSVTEFYDTRWYLSHFLDFQAGPLAIWNGGFSLSGLALGALLAFIITVRKHDLSLLVWADILAPGCILVLVLAPWANIVNRQMFGPSSSLPWALALSSHTDLPPAARFHPAPAYLSLWAFAVLIAVAVIMLRWAAWMRSGDIAFIGAILYLPALFLIGFLHVDVSRPLLGLSTLQLLALVGWAASMAFFLRRLHLRCSNG